MQMANFGKGKTAKFKGEKAILGQILAGLPCWKAQKAKIKENETPKGQNEKMKAQKANMKEIKAQKPKMKAQKANMKEIKAQKATKLGPP